MNFKHLVRDSLPPILSRAITKASHLAHGMGIHTFEGHYRSLSDVPCGTAKYDDADLATSISKGWLAKLRGDQEPVIDATGYLILPLIAATLKGQPLTIIDFGGGAGVGLLSLLDHVEDIDRAKLHFVIVETPAMVLAIKDEIAETVASRFGSDFRVDIRSDVLATSASIVHIGSAIQYIDDYRATLSALAKCGPKYFIVSQTPFTPTAKTYARQQLNMPGKRLATWVFNRTEFIETMGGMGYRLIFSVRHDLELTHKGAPEPSYMESAVFRGPMAAI